MMVYRFTSSLASNPNTHDPTEYRNDRPVVFSMHLCATNAFHIVSNTGLVEGVIVESFSRRALNIQRLID